MVIDPGWQEDEERYVRSAAFRDALRAYARLLIARFGADLSWLSATGLSVGSSQRVELWVERAAMDAGRDVGVGVGIDGVDHPAAMRESQRASAPPTLDRPFFDQWLGGDRKRLLVVAPFGSGKSVLLADLTCRLARDLIDEVKYPPGGIPPPVPLPVRLRDRIGCPDEPIERFAFEVSRRRLRLNADPDLAPSDLGLLLRGGILLPLFDGFDELPELDGTEAKRPVRHEALLDIDAFAPRFHILASRPGHGAERLYGADEQFTLRQLSVAEVEQFVRTWFGLREDGPASPADPDGDPGGQRVRRAGESRWPIRAFFEAEPHISRALCRPLFAASWCESVGSGAKAPTSLSEMMGVVLQRVFDQRRPRIDIPRSEVLRRRVELGAVLIPFADHCFDPLSTERLTSALAQWPLPSGHAAVSQWAIDLAVEGGLLVPHGVTYVAIKVPVVEYLVGCYLAWLCEGEGDAAPGVDRRQLFFKTFQKWFWWRDISNVWLYAFDTLWRGSAAQIHVAADCVRWVLAFSDRCRSFASWTGELRPYQLMADREPPHFSEVALGIMLPFGTLPDTGSADAEGLVQQGFDQMLRESLEAWENGAGSSEDFGELSFRRGRQLCDRLFDMLANDQYRQRAEQIAFALTLVGGDADPDRAFASADRLVGMLAGPASEKGWYWIGWAIGNVTAIVGGDRAQTIADGLLRQLRSTVDEAAMLGYAFALSKAAESLNADHAARLVDELLPMVGEPTYGKAKTWLISALGRAVETAGDERGDVATRLLSDSLRSADLGTGFWITLALVEVTNANGGQRAGRSANLLFDLLRSAPYARARPVIANGFSYAVKNVEGTLVADVAQKLVDALHVKAYGEAAHMSLAYALFGTAGRLRGGSARSVADSLLPMLSQAAHPELSAIVASALAELPPGTWDSYRGIAPPHLRESLGERAFAGAWEQVAYIIAHIECYGRDRDASVGRVLAGMLRKQEYEAAWPSIAAALSRVAGSAAPADVSLAVAKMTAGRPVASWMPISETLCKLAGFFGPGEASRVVGEVDAAMAGRHPDGGEDAWRFAHDLQWAAAGRLSRRDAIQLGDRWGGDGRATDVRELVQCQFGLAWFVRKFEGHGEANRISYGVADRLDASVRLDPELVCAPARIRESLSDIAAPYDAALQSLSGLASGPIEPLSAESPRPAGLTLEGGRRAAPTDGTGDARRPATETLTTPPRYLFERCGENTWRVAFGIDPGFYVYEHLEGFEYIAQLLRRPGEYVSDVRLIGKGTEAEIEGAERQKPVPTAEPEEFERLREQLEDAKVRSRSPDAKVAAQGFRDRSAIAADLRSRLPKKGRPAMVVSDHKRAQNTVDRALEVAFARLEAVAKGALRAHFEKCIVKPKDKGYHRVYEKPFDGDWEVSWSLSRKNYAVPPED